MLIKKIFIVLALISTCILAGSSVYPQANIEPASFNYDGIPISNDKVTVTPVTASTSRIVIIESEIVPSLTVKDIYDNNGSVIDQVENYQETVVGYNKITFYMPSLQVTRDIDVKDHLTGESYNYQRI